MSAHQYYIFTIQVCAIITQYMNIFEKESMLTSSKMLYKWQRNH